MFTSDSTNSTFIASDDLLRTPRTFVERPPDPIKRVSYISGGATGDPRVNPTFERILRFQRAPFNSLRTAGILGCSENSILLRRKAWLPSAGTVTSIPGRARRSSIDFVPSLCYTTETEPQNESRPFAIPPAAPSLVRAMERSNGAKIRAVNL